MENHMFLNIRAKNDCLFMAPEMSVLPASVGMDTMCGLLLASFDADKNAWVADAGEYQVMIGASCKDIKQTAAFSLSVPQIVEKVATDLSPTVGIDELIKL